MNKSLLIIILTIIIFNVSCKKDPTSSGTGVTFPDSNFEALIRETLGKSTSDITSTDLESITTLDGTHRNISDISGIEYCTNLLELTFWVNQISDISALSGLVNLEYLDLDNNQISDISALSGLLNLEELDLQVNQISNISALSGLVNLEYLYLDDNQISDISTLSNLSKLFSLSLWYNQISDISALSDLTKLFSLSLWNNQISDISALIQNSGIDNGDYVWLSSNPLSEISINTYIPQLEARGVLVSYRNGKISTKFSNSHEIKNRGKIHSYVDN